MSTSRKPLHKLRFEDGGIYIKERDSPEELRKNMVSENITRTTENPFNYDRSLIGGLDMCT